VIEIARNYINEIDLRGQIIDNSPPSKTTAFLEGYAASRSDKVADRHPTSKMQQFRTVAQLDHKKQSLAEGGFKW